MHNTRHPQAPHPVLLAFLIACSCSSSKPAVTPDGSAGSRGANGGTDAEPPTVSSSWPNIGTEPCEAAATGSTLWVAHAESSGDGSESAPFNSIQAAAEAAQPGDTVLIQGGTYRETVVPPRDGEEGAPIRFKGCSGPSIISGSEGLGITKRGVRGGTITL